MFRKLSASIWAALALQLTVLSPLPVLAQDRPIDRVVIAGGVDVIGLNALDVVNIVPDRSLMDNIADTLLRWVQPGKLGPWLATEWKSVDPLTWELKLRQGVKFHNGEPFNAAAVKFFYDTMGDPKLQSPSKTNHTYVDRVEVVDEYTVRIITKTPYPTTPEQLALAHMIPPKYLQQVGHEGYRRKPVGTGPFRFVEHVKDDRLTFSANPDWWGGAPKIKTLIYRPIKEDAARVSALVAGEIDLAIDVPLELVPMIGSNRNVRIEKELSGRVFIILLNSRDQSLLTANPKVREAISYAIDRKAINDAIYGGTGAPAAWLDPAIFGFDPSSKPLPYDPARAKAPLKEAGYPNGIRLIFDTPAGRYPKDQEVAEAVAGQLSAADIRVEVRTNEWGVLTKRIFSHEASPMTLAAWGNANGTPESHLRLALRSNGSWSQTNDPVLDERVDRISVEMDPSKRIELYHEFQVYQAKTFPMVYLLQQPMFAGVSAKLDWFKLRSDERYYFYQNPGSVAAK